MIARLEPVLYVMLFTSKKRRFFQKWESAVFLVLLFWLWEQSLLAKAVCQFAVMLDVPASSRASSLPQWFCVGHNFVFTGDSVWERACSR
ncbi:Secreted protein [Pseudomonas brassicacearum]